MTEASLTTFMTEVVAQGTERRLALWMLKEDPFFRRLPPERYSEAIDFALHAGQTAAGTATSQYGRKPLDMAAALQVSVNRSDEVPRAEKTVLFSEYSDRPPTITLYTPSIVEVNILIRENGLAELLGVSDIEHVYLTHELYHHLEAKKLITGTAGFRIRTLSLGPLRLSTGLPSLGEIAADCFASVILRLRVPPKALQLPTIYRYNPEYAWKLLEEIKKSPA